MYTSGDAADRFTLLKNIVLNSACFQHLVKIFIIRSHAAVRGERVPPRISKRHLRSSLPGPRLHPGRLRQTSGTQIILYRYYEKVVRRMKICYEFRHY